MRTDVRQGVAVTQRLDGGAEKQSRRLRRDSDAEESRPPARALALELPPERPRGPAHLGSLSGATWIAIARSDSKAHPLRNDIRLD